MQSSDNLELAFKHELCSYPFALFDFSPKLHEVDKPALDDVILKIRESSVPVVDIPDDSIWYVLEGGALLQCILWSRSSTYGPPVHRVCVVRKY